MPRVLVVDDDDLVRFTLADILEDAGFEVLEARTAVEAADILKTDGVDAIITDIRMPGAFDGMELARWVYTQKPPHQGDASDGLDDVCLIGCSAGGSVLNKPFVGAEVIQELRRMLGM